MLKLFYPYKPHIVSQKFGESKACIDPKTDKVVGKNNTCPADYVDLYNHFGMKYHNGIDIVHPENRPLFAPINGVIEEIQTEPSRGLGIGIVSEGKYPLNGGVHYIKVRLWHLNAINVKLGQKVKVGDVIGLTGNTGFSSGPHTHFEIKPVEYNSNGQVYNVFQDNGVYGAIDPEPFWNNVYAQDFAPLLVKVNNFISYVHHLIKTGQLR